MEIGGNKAFCCVCVDSDQSRRIFQFWFGKEKQTGEERVETVGFDFEFVVGKRKGVQG